MKSNRIVVMLAADGISGLDISYGKNINTMYLNSHLNSEFVVRPAFLLGASETMWVTFSKGETSTRPLLLAQRQTNDGNNSRQVVDGTESTIEKIPDTGYEYFIDMPDVVLQNVGEWKFSITITELPVDVEYKGQVNATSDLPSSGNAVGDTYWVGGSVNSYYYWDGSAWAVLNIVAVSTSDVGTITVNMSVGGQIGGYATDLDIQVLYNFVLRVINRLSDYLPKIVDGYWWVWNSDSKAYVNSGEVATTLITLRAITGLTKVPKINDTITSQTATFNRVPQIGETYVSLASTSNALGGDTYICLMKYTAENTSTYWYVGATRGAKGEQGEQGEQGQKGDTGATGVGIANVKQEVVTGGTQVTITLTNGTSSSFIVYNGTADNITNLEFPYGDAVVTYDNVDGLHIHGNCRVTINGITCDIPMDVEVPQTAGDGLTEDATSDAKGSVLKVDETVVRTNKANQIINGNVTISGNVTVNGTVTSVSAQNLKVKNKLIVVAEGNTVTLTSPAGLLAPKYDGTNNGALVFDGTGTAYVGDVVLTPDGDIDVAKSDLQPLATRGTLVNGNIVKWNGEKLRLEDTGIAAGDVAKKSDLGKVGNFIYKSNYESATIPTIGQVLTLTNANFSRTPVVGDVFTLMEVVNVNDTYYNNMEVLTVGDTTCTAKIMSFTDITSCKVTKVTEVTPTKQVYAKNADGTQGMVNVGGTADDDIATVGQVNATEPYHIELTSRFGTLTQEQFDKLAADDRSYVYLVNEGVIVTKSITRSGYINFGASDNTNQYLLQVATNLKYSFTVWSVEDVNNKKNEITGTGNATYYPTTKAVVDYVAANAPSAYHVELTDSDSGSTLSVEQYNALKADVNSYILLENGPTFRLTRVLTTDYGAMQYQNVTGNIARSVSITDAGVWTFNSETVELTSNKTTTLSASSTNTQYPSAEATYNADQSTLAAAKSYTDTAIANAITTALNTPV